jgi:hypothetical protein
VDLTDSHKRALPRSVLSRYAVCETRQAAVILQATNPRLFDEIVSVLNGFEVVRDDLLVAGGQESKLAQRFNKAFRDLGWREARVDIDMELRLRIMPYRVAKETETKVVTTPVSNKGYKVDNFKGRVALDLEWNAKDGNLDRDIGAYRALYDAGFIDVGVIVTRTQDDLHTFATRLRLDAGMDEAQAKKMLATTTTTNLEKLTPRMTRGDSGGCPILAIAISSRTFENALARPSPLTQHNPTFSQEGPHAGDGVA